MLAQSNTHYPGNAAYQPYSIYQTKYTHPNNLNYNAPSVMQTAVPQQKSLAESASRNRFFGTNDQEYSSHTFNVHGVVPTGLFTSYMPAAKFEGMAVQSSEQAPRQDILQVHNSRMLEQQDVSSEMGEKKRPETVIHYTVDQYPPYYSTARKTRATRRSKPGCCQ